MEEGAENEPLWRIASRYFLHGILFSVLMLVLSFAWAILLVGLVLTGLIIGFIIGIVVLFIIMGGLNSFLTDMIWGVRIKSRWMSLLGHGFALLVVLLVASIPSIVINLAVPGITTTVVMFVIYAFIDGFLARKVAGYWREEEDQEEGYQDEGET